MYANTKKELFLGKNPFTAKKLTPDELISKMIESLAENVDTERLEFNAEELKGADHAVQIETIILTLREAMSLVDPALLYTGMATESIVFYKNLAKPFETRLAEELKIDGAITIGDVSEETGKIVTMENGFSYLCVYCNGYDTVVPVLALFYIGADDQIHGYVPMYGNNVFAGTNFQLGSMGGNDAEEWDKLLDECNIECDKNDFEDYNEACLRAYAQKYGIERSSSDEEYIDGDIYETTLEINEEYVKEDILSNLTLV